MLQTGVIVQLLLALTLARGGAHPPRTVVDYYLLLPSKYFEGLATDTRSERMRLFRDFKGSFIDRQHGFLHIRGDGAQPSSQGGAEGMWLMPPARGKFRAFHRRMGQPCSGIVLAASRLAVSQAGPSWGVPRQQFPSQLLSPGA